MATITISIPDDVKLAMSNLDEVNWSGFIRKKVVEKINMIKLKESVSGKVEQDMKESQFWIEKVKESRKNREKELRAEGLI